LISLLNIFEEWFDDTRMVVNIDVINVMNRPTVPNATTIVMGYVIRESDEFFCRRAVFPPDSFVDLLQHAQVYAA
jgi:hypothetical protein